MHELEFADAISPSVTMCLRLPLRPYTLGHELLLLRQRNAFLTLAEAQFNSLPAHQQRAALITAALICSNTWADNQKPSRGLRLWGWLIRRANYPLEIAHFRNYLHEAYNTTLKTLNPDDEEDVRADEMCAEASGYEPMTKLKGRSLGAPLIARLLQFITAGDLPRHFGYATPFDFPYAFAVNLYQASSEEAGGARIEGHAEREAKRKWADDVEWARQEEAKQAAASPVTRHSSPGLATLPPDLEAAGDFGAGDPFEPSTLNADV